MKKPEFPKPRVIREDFLPKQDIMTNYRIKKITQGYTTKYYPQSKFLGLFWVDEDIYGFDSYEKANRALCDYLRDHYLKGHLRKPVVEYLEVDCGGNKND
jgi:hypothetical protein